MPSPVPAPRPAAPTVTRVGGAAAISSADAVVIGVLPGAGSAPVALAAGADELAAAFATDEAPDVLVELLAVAGATGRAEQVVKLPTRGSTVGAPLLVAVGLGAPTGPGGAPSAEQVRRAAGAAARALTGHDHVVTTLGVLDPGAATEGLLLGGYTFTDFRSAARANGGDTTAEDTAAPSRIEVFTADDPGAAAAVDTAAATAAAIAGARDLVNTPPNELYPQTFAERASAWGREAGLTVEVLEPDALAEGGYGGVLGVGQGSERAPRLVRLHWAGGTAPRAHVALVGKGVTFDTGGISIKPAAGMDKMTSDMGGAAAVIATTVLAARLNLPVAVTATVPMVENMPSGSAYRPGDVLRMRGGRTVEVLNTDAEGRLILADAIVRAAEDDPDYLVEVSTLTGAAVVAFGVRTTGVMGSDALRDRVAAHGRAVGEDAWAMPLPEYLRRELDSRVADIANVTGKREGGMLAAGVFLREFVPDGLAWAHLDIAGPSFHSATPYGYTTKGGTGVPVRTLAALLADIAEHG